MSHKNRQHGTAGWHRDVFSLSRYTVTSLASLLFSFPQASSRLVFEKAKLQKKEEYQKVFFNPGCIRGV
jgi:hypothetical protein